MKACGVFVFKEAPGVMRALGEPLSSRCASLCEEEHRRGSDAVKGMLQWGCYSGTGEGPLAAAGLLAPKGGVDSGCVSGRVLQRILHVWERAEALG